MTKDIQKTVANYLVESGYESVCENYGHTLFEMDIAVLSKSAMLYEFEVKVSRSDFLADKNKGSKNGRLKFTRYEDAKRNDFGVPNYFYYVCPEDLIKENEIPIYAGLYYYSDGKIRIIKKAKRIHKSLQDKIKILSKMLRMTIQRKYLGGTMLTFKNNKIKERYTQLKQSNQL
jgi:hypothetical protein